MSTSFDLIMVVASKDASLIEMTQTAIDSCRADGADVNIIIVETFNIHKYRNVNIILKYEDEFCYNRCLNEGIKYAKNDIVILANNDIYFQPGWSTIGETMLKNDYLSASALSTDPRQRVFRRGNYAYEGYRVGYHITGWCIFAQRKLFDIIGRLDERVSFWYSDNLYAEQLIAKNIKHALICNVTVLHYTSKTLIKQKPDIRHQLTHAQRKKLYRVDPTNLQKAI